MCIFTESTERRMGPCGNGVKAWQKSCSNSIGYGATSPCPRDCRHWMLERRHSKRNACAVIQGFHGFNCNQLPHATRCVTGSVSCMTRVCRGLLRH